VNKLFSGESSVSGGIEAAPWGHWRGAGDPAPTEEEWVARIAAPSTPVGETIPWVKPLERTKVMVANLQKANTEAQARLNSERTKDLP
jgi:hypothetical protein